MPSTSKEPLSVENLKENPTDTGNDAGKDVIITNKVFIFLKQSYFNGKK